MPETAGGLAPAIGCRNAMLIMIPVWVVVLWHSLLALFRVTKGKTMNKKRYNHPARVYGRKARERRIYDVFFTAIFSDMKDFVTRKFSFELEEISRKLAKNIPTCARDNN